MELAGRAPWWRLDGPFFNGAVCAILLQVHEPHQPPASPRDAAALPPARIYSPFRIFLPVASRRPALISFCVYSQVSVPQIQS